MKGPRPLASHVCNVCCQHGRLRQLHGFWGRPTRMNNAESCSRSASLQSQAMPDPQFFYQNHESLKSPSQAVASPPRCSLTRGVGRPLWLREFGGAQKWQLLLMGSMAHEASEPPSSPTPPLSPPPPFEPPTPTRCRASAAAAFGHRRIKKSGFLRGTPSWLRGLRPR